MSQIDEATDVKQFELSPKFQETFDAWKKALEGAPDAPGAPPRPFDAPAPCKLRILGEEPIIGKDGATAGLLIFYRTDPYED